MKGKLFVAGILFACLMFTGCPDTLVHNEPLDCTGAYSVAPSDESAWAAVEQVAVESGYGVVNLNPAIVPVVSDGDGYLLIEFTNNKAAVIKVTRTNTEIVYKDWVAYSL